MPDQASHHIIANLQRKWQQQMLLCCFILAVAFTLVVGIVSNKIVQLHPLWSIVIFAATLTALLIISRSWRLSLHDVSRLLNSLLPQLEESAPLLLKPITSLNFLEELQVRKIEELLTSTRPPEPVKKYLNSSFIFLITAVVISSIVFILPARNSAIHQSIQPASSLANKLPEKMLPQIRNARITITPPAYTGNSARQQNRFNVQAEEGAMSSWIINTNIAVKKVQIVFNDRSILSFVADEDRTQWKAQKIIRASGFYQVKINESLSDLYMIEAIKDQPPTLTIQSPKPNTVIEYGEPEQTIVKVNLTDDYGLADAAISATISSGSGEAVKFKEQQLRFSNFLVGAKQIVLKKIINLHGLGMQPGDELYFYITARDNGGHQKRSDVYIIRLQDTADLMSMDGLSLGVNLKPEFFRSQRQIIIETEQLLKDKDTISQQKFNNKSNDLGIDQKLLRMRYGKFLGEETDTEIGGEHHDEHEGGGGESSGDIMKEYGHTHDNAEDATFFDKDTKKQLKATLNEMWNAEVRLRTFRPKEALPYEYKALRLLKDLQQRSRVYVAKTGIKVTPLNNDKRLSGDLSKINQPVISTNRINADDVYSAARKALGILEQLRSRIIPTESGRQTLQQAYEQLSVRAVAQPSAYLQSLGALRKILNKQHTQTDIIIAQQGLQKMIMAAPKLPYPAEANPATNLSKKYFNNLNKGTRQR